MRLGWGIGLALALWLGAGLAGEEFDLVCSKTSRFLAPMESADRFKYAPDRGVDILHVALDVTPDFTKRSVEGRMTMRFKPIARELGRLRLDAVRLGVRTVESSVRVKAWEITDAELVVNFEKPVPVGEETTVTVSYSAEPEQGLYFRTPEMGYKAGEAHVFSQGEAIEARHWYPCFDAPNEKFTSEIRCRVPEGMTVISNGRKMSEEKESGTGMKAVRWLQDKPHTTYLMTLVAGYFSRIEDRYKDIPMSFYTLPSEIQYATNSFRGTREAMAFFEGETGVPYPWAKYDQICVNDFVAGGMENTSATTLTDGTLYSDASENVRSSEELMAHELAHQWFGDLVTTKDWTHLWLNEGFATYYAHLFDGHKNGLEHMLYGLYEDARGFFDVPDDTRPIVWRGYEKPMDMFGFLVYPKGSWVLHMLRSQLGPDLFRRCVQTYLERHQYGLVVTEDLNQVVEELSGRSFDQFFNQYVYHAHQPELGLSYSWEESTRMAKLTVVQNQKLSEKVLLFRFPVTVRFKVKGAVVDRPIVVKEKSEDFYFALPEAPESVRFDPEYTVLARVDFTPSGPMLVAQLKDTTDVIGRLLGVEILSKRKDAEAVRLLGERLQQDPFYGVRVQSARALRSIHSREALGVLMASREQKDARVRREVVAGLGGFFDETAKEALMKVLESEKNPDILAEALSGLAPYHSTAIREVVLGLARTESHRNRVAEAAVRVMRSQDDVGYVKPLMQILKERAGAFEVGGLGTALETLGWLTRNEAERGEVRELLLSHTRSLRQGVRLAAIGALGTLGDPKAVAALQTYARAGRQTAERGVAEKAVESIRSTKKPGTDLKSIREEVLELQRANTGLKGQFEELKKKMEAQGTVEKASGGKDKKGAGKK